MRIKLFVLTICLNLLFCSTVSAQTHTSVSLEDQIYYILEQAALRGLCPPLSGVRPYTQKTIVGIIDEILLYENSKYLNDTEYEILLQYLDKFLKSKDGIDLSEGVYRNETAIGNNNIPLTFNAGASLHIESSGGFYSPFSENYAGTEIWVGGFLNGDIGKNVSWAFSGEGGLMLAPIKYLGNGNTYYDGFDNTNPEYQNETIYVYSEPLTHFPYSYKKRWDGSIYFFDDLSLFRSWPGTIAGGYNMLSELSASFLENKVIARLGRISHEWGSTPIGSSLAFNQMARPFLGIEAEFNPVSWFGISSLTGFLEYNNNNNIEGKAGGIKDSAKTFQNLFSITMLQFRYKNYLFFDFIDAVVYPKRFELGYISPITNSFFYQNNIGDFDNMAMTINLKAQYPGLGNIWFSFFMDEMDLTSNWFTLDRQMIAWQAGINASLPFLSFSSVKLSYTKINPYCYTHNRNFNPWYGDRMETSYTNNGVSLGYYLPPNSDEILVRFQTMPAENIKAHFQFQLIRHGADFGESAVDGSNLLSELDPNGRDGSHDVLKRFFLKDGAYQWLYIVKFGAEWNIPNLPFALFGEAGFNFSYFTNTNGRANSGSAYPYSVIDTSEYPKSSGFIFKLGVKIFPR